MIEQMETTVKLKGLDPDKFYKLENDGEVYSGSELMHAGLTMYLPAGDFLSRQLILNIV